MSINSYLENCASSLVLSTKEKDSITTSIETLENRLELYFGTDIIEKFKFGSYTRGTILPRKVDDNSDIDYMVVFDNYNNYNPQTFLDRLKRFALSKYSTSEIHQSFPTIVLELNHIKFELVPAYKYSGTYYIPNGNGGWMPTYPNAFNDKLIETNSYNSSKIKPLVRLLKHWNVNINSHALTSYQIEERIAYNMQFAFIYCSSYADYVKAGFKELKNIAKDYNTLNRIYRALEIIENAIKYENTNAPYLAALEIEKIFPEV